jgi:hypothetical protein
MTDAEVRTVARIMLTADGWCSNCNSDLLDQLRVAFPEHTVAISEVERDADRLHGLYNESVIGFSDKGTEIVPVWQLP